MTDQAKAIRNAIGDVGFSYWVRVWRDGEISVGAHIPSETRQAALSDRLTQAGYKIEHTGKPGTAGAYTITIL